MMGPGVTGCFTVAASRSAAVRRIPTASSFVPSAQAVPGENHLALDLHLLGPRVGRISATSRRHLRRRSWGLASSYLPGG